MSYTHKTTPLPETYDTAAIEKKWQKHWEEHKIYAWDASVSRANSFVIDTPPPTVSGTLHMGHVFSYTQADFVARYQRMMGKNVFYPMGFDDNGLPTERLVEKEKKIRAVDKSREEFIQICLGVSEAARKEFRALFESIALSVDWAQEYHTISDSSRALSQASFLDLVNKGHCYRALRPFYWDPVDQTAIAQAEIVDKEMASHQNIILFEVDGVKVPVMTTRPELLPACVALMYHPDDADKYAGKEAITPLFGVRVPMIADEKVDKEKGTGLVMCCTFGDDTDKEWWEKHKLQTRVILNKYGKLDESALRNIGIAEALVEAIKNKRVSNSDPKSFGARQIIMNMLAEVGLVVDVKPITHSVKCAERSGEPLEILPSEQWFVKVSDKKEALKARTEECTWHPEWMKLRMLQWIDGLNQDWCISRQRYFGVPFPVWYVRKYGSTDAFTAVYPQPKQSMPVNPLAELPKGMIKIPGLTFESVGSIGAFASEDIVDINGNVIFSGNSDIQLEVVPDFDVMDTWATSSISPQLSAGAICPHPTPLPEGEGTSAARGEGERFQKLFPADLRPQAHEIIRTWAFYTLVKAHLHNASIPWHNLMISGWCLAEDKTKMSKSKGNVVTPVALIEEKGTDAVRYWAATSRLGQDTAFSPDLLKIGKKLVNKLWNATQFAAIHLSKMNAAPQTAATDAGITEVLDQWILSRLGETVKAATDAFNGYEYAVALDATNQFFWADFCDNYLELIKARVYNEEGKFTAAQQQSAVRALYYCLEGILKLYAPIVPHVTEELYSHIFAEAYAAKGSLHARGQWVKLDDYKVDADALAQGKTALEVLEKVRSEKSTRNVSIKFPVKLLTIGNEYTVGGWIDDVCGAGNVGQWQQGSSTSIELAETADAA
jgi:valyl-tRNA synthetase